MLHRDPAAPFPKRRQSPTPIFGPCLLWPNGWMDQDGTWHGGGPRSRPHCARWGLSSPPQIRGHSPQYTHISIVVKLLDASRCQVGMKVGLVPGHTVLDGTQHPHFSAHVCCSQRAGWIKVQLSREVGRGPRHIVRWGPTSPPPNGIAPNFWPMSIVAERSPISATAEHLLHNV